MRSSSIQELLLGLGVRRLTITGNKVRSTCPLGPWRHSSGRDEHPSFVVFVDEDGSSRCKCLGAACSFKGSLTELLWAYETHSRVKLDKYHRFVINNDTPDVGKFLDKVELNLGIYSRNKDMPGSIEGGVDHAELIQAAENATCISIHDHRVAEMQKMLTVDSIKYLNDRGISNQAIVDWKLGWHPGAQRISIPQYDIKNRLVNIGGRYFGSDDNPFWTPIPWMHAKDFKKELFLFGEDKFVNTDGTGTMVLVEGMFDAIFLSSKGIRNSAAMLGAYVSKAQYSKIVRWFNKLVIVPDGDPPGMKAANQIFEQFHKKIETVVYPTPDGLDPDQLTDEEICNLSQNYIDKI